MALLKGVAEIKFLGNSSLKLVIDSMTALASVLALNAALGSVTFVFTEGAAVSIRTVTCLSFLLRTQTIISAEVWQRAFTRDATDIGCFIFTPFASKQSLRVEDVSRSSTVTETAAARSKAIVLLYGAAGVELKR